MPALPSLLLFGIALTCSGVTSRISRYLHIPQVIGHLLTGIVLGISGIKIFNSINIPQFGMITDLTLGLIGFLIGGELRWARLKRFGISILCITIFESFLAASLVFVAIYLFTKNLPLSLILGALASATAPGGTTSVLQEYKARGPLTSTLFGVVGADDAVSIMIFAFAANISKMVLTNNDGFQIINIVHIVGYDIIGSIVLGLLIAFFVTLIMLIVRYDDMQQLVIISALFVCSGLSQYLGLSLILSNMAMGIFIGNYRPHRSRSYFLKLQKLTPVIFILFFILIGARLDIKLLSTTGFVGILYIIVRMFGKYVGAFTGASLAKSPKNVRNYLGLCLFSQAGVAIGLAIAAQRLFEQISPEAGEIGWQIINIITATTFIFQIIGPLFTKIALQKANEIHNYPED